MEDKLFENSRNVTIKLHRRVGKFVKLKLYFSNQWIMISEIVFDSGENDFFLLLLSLLFVKRCGVYV